MVDVVWINIKPTYTKKQKRFGICGSQTGKYKKDGFWNMIGYSVADSCQCSGRNYWHNIGQK